MPSKDGWSYDYASKQWLYFDLTARCWRNQRQERVNSPQFDESPPAKAPAPSTGSASVTPQLGTNAARTSARDVTQTTGIESAVEALTLNSSTREAQSTTARDPISGVETRYEVSASADPDGSSGRSINLKRIREWDTPSLRGIKPSENPQSDYKSGRVIEVYLVPPSSPSVSNLSRITPYETPENHTTSVRLRRFVIVRDNMPGGTTFLAVPIKTYNGQGVGSSGVPKSHHAVIYTHTIPKIRSSEKPGRNETGMQAQPIRVVPYDNATKLDPMARLDYGDRHEFDYKVPNMGLFGRVHKDSEAQLYAQYHLVWLTIENAIRGTTATPGNSAPPPTTGGSRTAVPPSRRTGLTSARQDGAITDQQMQTILRSYQAFAARNNLEMPGQQLNATQLHGLAQSPALRVRYLKRIRETWEADSDTPSE